MPASVSRPSRKVPGTRVRDGRGTDVESGPAIFAGTVFVLFGGGLLLWTGVRVRQGAPVVYGASPALSATLATAVGTGSLLLGAWCFGRL